MRHFSSYLSPQVESYTANFCGSEVVQLESNCGFGCCYASKINRSPTDTTMLPALPTDTLQTVHSPPSHHVAVPSNTLVSPSPLHHVAVPSNTLVSPSPLHHVAVPSNTLVSPSPLHHVTVPSNTLVSPSPLHHVAVPSNTPLYLPLVSPTNHSASISPSINPTHTLQPAPSLLCTYVCTVETQCLLEDSFL